MSVHAHLALAAFKAMPFGKKSKVPISLAVLGQNTNGAKLAILSTAARLLMQSH